MDRVRATLGSLLFLVVAPGTVCVLLPWMITGWVPASRLPPWWPVVAALGWLLISAGAVFLLSAFGRFVLEGRGTPAPVAPTAELVTGGVYAWVRNPMYLAVWSVIAGQGLVLGRWQLAAYLVIAAATMVAFVRGYEEPRLRATYGEQFDTYRARVPAGSHERPGGTPVPAGPAPGPVDERGPRGILPPLPVTNPFPAVCRAGRRVARAVRVLSWQAVSGAASGRMGQWRRPGQR